MKQQQIDVLVAQDPYLREFLRWASRKPQIPAETSEATVRSFHLALAQTPHRAADFAIACTPD